MKNLFKKIGQNRKIVTENNTLNCEIFITIRLALRGARFTVREFHKIFSKTVLSYPRKNFEYFRPIRIR